MNPRHIKGLTEDQRDRIRERACILWEANPGMTWEEADRLALVAEGLAAPTLPGVE